MLAFSLWSILSIVSGVIAYTQKPIQILSSTSPFQTYDTGFFTPLETLDSISSDVFTTLKHPFFPIHSVRIKRLSDFCNSTAR